MVTAEPLCVLEDVKKQYGKKGVVLGPASFEVREGEILGLRGVNGAGKSTLLKIIAGILKPDSGTCRLWPKCRGAIGYVPQETALYESLTGLANLEFWGEAYGLPRQAVKKRSRWLLEQTELAEKGGTVVSAYSGGMRRRLHLASALMVTPKLLLLDEPTVGADPHSVDLILGLLGHLKKLGIAIVWVTHQEGELERISDRILTVDGGRVIGEEIQG